MDIYYKDFDTIEELNMFFVEHPQHKVINIETIFDSHDSFDNFIAWFSSGDNIATKQKYYQVFEVNDCFEEYGMSNFYVGAKDKDDLIEHLYEIGGKYRTLTKKLVRWIINDKDWRIKEVEHMFTDTPYVSLDNNGYIE